MPEQEIIPPRGPGFQPGHERYGGRKPGQIGRHARLLKELILMAAELEGSDGEGRDGLLGYLRKIAREDMRVFAMLLGRVLPLQVETKNDQRETVVCRSVEEIRADLEARGISIEAIKRVLCQPMDDDE